MKFDLRIFLILIFFLGACESNVSPHNVAKVISNAEILEKNKQIFGKIASEIGATNCELSISDDQNNLTGQTRHFLLFRINGTDFVNASQNTKYRLASYSATQLYKRLDQNLVANNSAIDIIFNDEEDRFNGKKYYFEMPELEKAWKAFDFIDKYLGYIRNDDMTNVNASLDTTYCYLNTFIDNNKTIKAKLGKSIIKTYNSYAYDTLRNLGRTRSTPCLSVSTSIFDADSNEVHIGFWIPIDAIDSKIMSIGLELKK